MKSINENLEHEIITEYDTHTVIIDHSVTGETDISSGPSDDENDEEEDDDYGLNHDEDDDLSLNVADDDEDY
jgi:hypothetical protein